MIGKILGNIFNRFKSVDKERTVAELDKSTADIKKELIAEFPQLLSTEKSCGVDSDFCGVDAELSPKEEPKYTPLPNQPGWYYEGDLNHLALQHTERREFMFDEKTCSFKTPSIDYRKFRIRAYCKAKGVKMESIKGFTKFI